MRRNLSILSVLLLCLSASAFAGEFQDPSAVLAVDFPAGWSAGKSDDPAVALKLEHGKAFFEFSRLDSELSDYYLKARVKEQVDSLRGKGNSLAGDIREAGIRGAAVVYYTAYESMGVQGYMAFFTYNGLSYAISASGLEDEVFRGIVATIRKPGEKIEVPKPRKIRVLRKPARIETAESVAQVLKENAPAVSTAPVEPSTPAAARVWESSSEPAGVVAAAAPDEPSAGAQALQKAQSFFADLERKQDVSRTPYIPRKPLNFMIWCALAVLWAAGSAWARGRAGKLENPRLSPPPKDIPPDFFFPFIISRTSTLKDCTYNVITRQKQLLLASFNSEHEPYVAGPIYAAVLFHVVWSFLAFIGRGYLVTGVLLSLPGGRFWASAPEIFFAAPLIAGISMYCNKKQVLRLFDSHSSPLMEAGLESGHCLIRDLNGKEIARVVKKGGLTDRAWDFIDTDNQVVFTVKDDYPAVHILRKLFGNLGGALRGRYGIFAAERRAGFVYLDPASADRFQIHLDFDFARLAHPAHILVCLLYIISTEKDPFYPSPF